MADRPSPGSQRSVVPPSPVVLLSIVAVVMAVVAFVATRTAEPVEREVVTTVREESTPSATPTTDEPAEPRKAEAKAKAKAEAEPKPVERASVYVEVYNNSGITGLASTVGAQVTDAGWRLVGTDNWYGTIPTNTVYFPPRLEREAKQLALDVGIDRTAPADGAMKLDRLTVVLTGEL